MRCKMIKKDPIKLVGISVRTNNIDEFNADKARIGATMQQYFKGGLANKINDRKNPGVTFAAYTNYDSDFTGNYTYFLGEEVNSFDKIPEGFESITIPEQNYVKFTSEPGLTQTVIVNTWKKIWYMPSDKLNRAYKTDFEVYDRRKSGIENDVVNIYIGVKTA